MVGWHQNRVAVPVLAPAQPGNRVGSPQQRLRGKLAERDDDFGLDRIDLSKQERLALLHFVRLGIPVAWWAALDDVGDVDIPSLQADGLDDLGEELSGTADSPTNMRSALGLPTPKTICRRPKQ